VVSRRAPHARVRGACRSVWLSRGCRCARRTSSIVRASPRVEKQQFGSLKLGEKAFEATFHLDPSADNFGIDPKRANQRFLKREVIAACENDTELREMLDAEEEQLQKDRVSLREIFQYREPDKEADPNAHAPVNLMRLIWCARSRGGVVCAVGVASLLRASSDATVFRATVFSRRHSGDGSRATAAPPPHAARPRRAPTPWAGTRRNSS